MYALLNKILCFCTRWNALPWSAMVRGEPEAQEMPRVRDPHREGKQCKVPAQVSRLVHRHQAAWRGWGVGLGVHPPAGERREGLPHRVDQWVARWGAVRCRDP